MRLSRDEWGLRLAEVTALRGTCFRRQVGCVLVNADGRVLATGYNGVASGLPHCNELVPKPIYGKDYSQTIWVDDPDRKGGRKQETNVLTPCLGFEASYPNACAGSHAASGTQLSACEAIHAEANALLQCDNVREVHAAYVTASPCIDCVKLLMNTGCRRVVFREEYPHNSKALWVKPTDKRAAREWLHLQKGEA